jgi:acyl carrier protein
VIIEIETTDNLIDDVAHIAAIGGPIVPPLFSKRLRLREIAPADYGFLYHLATEPDSAYRYRFRAGLPSFEEYFSGFRHANVFMNLLIVSADEEAPQGTIMCYQADFRNRHAYLAMQMRPELMGHGLAMEAAELLIRYLFGGYDFEKLYVETLGFSLPRFASVLSKLFEIEGRLRNHERFGGKSWDLYTLALYKTRWLEWEERREPTTEKYLSSVESSGPTFERFTQDIRGTFELGPTVILNEDTRIVEDLDFDSLGFYELVCLMEEYGAQVPDHVVPKLRTLGDAHFCCLQYR